MKNLHEDPHPPRWLRGSCSWPRSCSKVNKLHEDPRPPRWLPGSCLLPHSCSKLNNFTFTFDKSNFPNQIMRIEVISDLADTKINKKGLNDVANWAWYRIPGGDFVVQNENDSVMITQHEEKILNCHMPDSEECVPYGNQDEEATAMVEETPADVELKANQIGTSIEGSDPLSSGCSAVVRVKTMHISSPILAAKSPFFYKLFSNGMRESEQRHVTLRIHESEEAALMDLVNFMYRNTLPRTSPSALLEVLMAADKYEVASCMSYCCRLLQNIPMTPESALLYLNLPSNVLMADAVQPLTVCAKQFLASRYKDFTKFLDEVLNLPLAGIEGVFSSNDLQIGSEDGVFDFLLKWARHHYPILEERKEIVGTHLLPLIRFPFMSCRRLKKALTCVDLDGELARKAILEALFFKTETLHRQNILAQNQSNPLHKCFVPRAYRYRPVKVMEFEQPRQECVVYLDLQHEECKHLYPVGRVYSQAFSLGAQGFFLSAHCQVDHSSNFLHTFGLFLGMQEKGSASLWVDYEFATRSKPTNGYVSRYKGSYQFSRGKAVGYRNLFGMSWEELMAEDSQHFINGVLHIRAELSIRK